MENSASPSKKQKLAIDTHILYKTICEKFALELHTNSKNTRDILHSKIPRYTNEESTSFATYAWYLMHSCPEYEELGITYSRNSRPDEFLRRVIGEYKQVVFEEMKYVTENTVLSEHNPGDTTATLDGLGRYNTFIPKAVVKSQYPELVPDTTLDKLNPYPTFPEIWVRLLTAIAFYSLEQAEIVKVLKDDPHEVTTAVLLDLVGFWIVQEMYEEYLPKELLASETGTGEVLKNQLLLLMCDI